MMRELIAINLPWIYGGASAEMLGAAILWSRLGIPFRFSNLGATHKGSADLCDARGWIWSQYQPGDWNGQVVASWNNPLFLAELCEDDCKPAKAAWFDCMTVAHPAEAMLCKLGRITHVGYVSDHQRKILEPNRHQAEVLDYRPYFAHEGPDGIAWIDRPDREVLTLGHVSRDDPMKFPMDLWHKVRQMTERAGRPIRFRFLGFGPKCREFFGEPETSNVEMLNPMQECLQSFLGTVECLWHEPGPAGESMGRVVVEAMLSGMPVMVPMSHAFPEFVTNATGWLYSGGFDLYRSVAELCRLSHAERTAMGLVARKSAVERFGREDVCGKAWLELLE